MKFDTNEYLSFFLQDAEEHLEIMTDALLALEESTDDPEGIRQLFRVAHTLKSSSAMVGLSEISEFTHHVEDSLSEVRDGSREANQALVTALFRCFDLLRVMLNAVQDGTWDEVKASLNKETVPALTQLRGEAVAEEESAPSAHPAESTLDSDIANKVCAIWQDREADGSHLYVASFTLQPDTPMPVARAFLILNQVDNGGEILRCDPDVRSDGVVLDEGETVTFYLADVSTEEDIHDQLDNSYIDTLSVRDITDEVEGAERASPPATKRAEKRSKTAPPRRQQGEVARTQTVRVEIDKLDALLEFVGELVIARGRVAELGRKIEKDPSLSNAHDLSEALQSQGMILTQLQEAIMEARMVPVGNVLTRFRRLVRDLSVDVKKEVALVIEGEETELDKKVIDTIGDPLTHLIRNAIDHGLECPEMREKAGKPREGRLLLAAGREGNNVTLTVGDDGQGLNVETIKKKAIERNLASEEVIEKMDEDSIIRMIFMPGFSTAEKVTDVSGRGVGMDVVRRTIEELGGSIAVKTTHGEGSSFIIRIPLTLAIIHALLIEVGAECYALPISDVVEMLRIGDEDITTIEGRCEVIQVRGKVIPLVRLCDALDVPPPARRTKDSRMYVALVQQANKVIGLVVDNNRGEREIVIKSLGSDLESSPLLAGASILGDGEVVLILDTSRVIQYAQVGKVETA